PLLRHNMRMIVNKTIGPIDICAHRQAAGNENLQADQPVTWFSPFSPGVATTAAEADRACAADAGSRARAPRSPPESPAAPQSGARTAPGGAGRWRRRRA